MHYPYQSPQTHHIVDYCANRYDATPEYLWPEQSPSYCVFRHQLNHKWFGIIMTIPGSKLGLLSDKPIEIINLKFDPGQALDFTESNPHIYPAYHMNKRNWITIILDDSLSDDSIFCLIDKSFDLTSSTLRRAKPQN